MTDEETPATIDAPGEPSLGVFLLVAAVVYTLLEMVPVMIFIASSDQLRDSGAAGAMLVFGPLASIANFAIVCLVPLWIVFRLGRSRLSSLVLELLVLAIVGVIVAAAFAFANREMVQNGVVYAVDGVPTRRFAIESALNLALPYLVGVLLVRPRPWKW